MDKVADKNGVPVQGIMRDSSYGLVVNDPAAYNKYLVEKNRIQEIDSLKLEVSRLQDMVKELITHVKK